MAVTYRQVSGQRIKVGTEQMKASDDLLRGRDWRISVTHNETNTFTVSHEEKHTILLQEIRDELKKLNGVIGCVNFTRLPRTLSRIDRRLATRMLLSGETPKRRKGRN